MTKSGRFDWPSFVASLRSEYVECVRWHFRVGVATKKAESSVLRDERWTIFTRTTVGSLFITFSRRQGELSSFKICTDMSQSISNFDPPPTL